MKRAILLTLSVLLICQGFIIAQENAAGKTGISFSSFGNNKVFRFSELDGAASYSGDHFFTVGGIYLHPVNGWLEAETGLEYSKHNIIIKPNLPPGFDDTPQKAHFSLLNIPLTLRANFLKYFFINGGLFADIDISTSSAIDNQTGIGALLGISVKYDFKNGISVFGNPYTKLHSLIPFSDTKYHQGILETGIRIGITCDLRKK